MGDESKRTEVKKGNTDPLHAPRKPSSAESVDPVPVDSAEMPTEAEIDRRDPRGGTDVRRR